ncbi:cytochrome P450 [Multifurca ochricompacta]|uniref:Cytochrome P450 n=1 Tax=Multifurca ochricompacta TaxID=376703 RepID=A0AAD4QLW9_9AGAM|nr:cytochrome P450 [Multifurca ochricompacta]
MLTAFHRFAIIASWLGVSVQEGLSFLLLVILLALFCVRYTRSPWRKLPPGPRGLPILGNITQLNDKRWLTSRECKATYGDIVYLNVLGRPIIILNSQKAAADLLGRRARIYSDRPRFIVASEILTGGMEVSFLQYGVLWRRMRRAAHEGLHKSAAKVFNNIQMTEAVLLASGILDSPEQWEKHMRRFTASMIMTAVYDTPAIHSLEDESVRRINDHVMRVAQSTLPGSHWVELLPWMKHIPSKFAKWKRTAEEWFRHDSEMFESLVESVRTNLAKGIDRPSLSATLLKNQSRSGLDERELAWLASTMYGAGAETTTGSMYWWMLAMIAFPETQRRAQAELDTVVGRGRIPSFSDLSSLPYLRAMVKEVLRWRSVLPVGIPHCSLEDDWYEGMFIPKGTMCLVNVGSCNHDTAIYGDDATLFNPSRHLNPDGSLAPSPPDTQDEGHVVYGFGKRICVGRHVANDTMFIAFAIVLWAMKLVPVKDEYGMDIPVDVNGYLDEGMLHLPLPFLCKIVPRFPEAIAILNEERGLRDF